MRSLCLLLLSTPVGPLGSGLGGGVELTIANLAAVLTARGHRVTVVTPEGAKPEASGLMLATLVSKKVEIVEMPGALQTTAQTQERTAPVTVSPVLANMWAYAQQVQARYDALINFAYDWLPFYLTPFLEVPVAHFVSMGSLNDGMDAAIAQLSACFPGTVGAYTHAQADTFSHLEPPVCWEVLGFGLDLSQYDYCDRPAVHAAAYLAWVGRISPEKGLEDAIAAAIAAHRPLKIFGKIEDVAYWQDIQVCIEAANDSSLADSKLNGSTPIEYCGFLSTDQLQQAIGQATALLITPRWVEAFGIVAIEALACGVPVIAYRQGGPAEIVQPGKTGWLVTPNEVSELVAAIAKVGSLNRADCRAQAETCYSLPAWGHRFEQWLRKIVAEHESSNSLKSRDSLKS